MPLISEYKVNNSRLRLILQGDPGSGKSTAASQFPGAWFFDVDLGLGGTLAYIERENKNLPEGKKLKFPIGFDVLDRDEENKPVPMPQRYLRLAKLIGTADARDDVQTLVFDSGTTLVDVFIAHVLKLANANDMTKREWGNFARFCKEFLNLLITSRKHIVFIVHEKIEKDEKGNVVYPITPNWPGQVGKNLGAFFTNHWRCETQSLPDGPGKTKTRRTIRTEPTSTHTLKNTLGLPSVFEFSWETIAEKLK